MNKTELNELKQECESFNEKVKELNDDELGYVVGGVDCALLAQYGICAFIIGLFDVPNN